MDYREGFKDAVSMFEKSINNAISNNNEKIDGIVETLNVAKFELSRMTHEEVEDTKEEI